MQTQLCSISLVLSKYQGAIVLEDDLTTGKNLFTFYESSSNILQKHQKVFSISGYTFDLAMLKNKIKTLIWLHYRSWGYNLERPGGILYSGITPIMKIT